MFKLILEKDCVVKPCYILGPNLTITAEGTIFRGPKFPRRYENVAEFSFADNSTTLENFIWVQVGPPPVQTKVKKGPSVDQRFCLSKLWLETTIRSESK